MVIVPCVLLDVLICGSLWSKCAVACGMKDHCSIGGSGVSKHYSMNVVPTEIRSAQMWRSPAAASALSGAVAFEAQELGTGARFRSYLKCA